MVVSSANPSRSFKYEGKTQKAAGSGTECPYGTNNFCTGSHGGQYGINASGNRNMSQNEDF